MSFRNYAHTFNSERSLASQEQMQKFQALVTRYAPLAPRNPQLRLSLLQIARNLGIDPLSLQTGVDSKKERENKVGVLCIGVVQEMWAQQGGNAALPQVQSQINLRLKSQKPVSLDEITDAVAKLEKLGPGLRIETLPVGLKVIRNAPTELSREQGDILAACDALGYVTIEMLSDNFGWLPSESQRVLDAMLSSGLLWIDEQSRPVNYWAPSAI